MNTRRISRRFEEFVKYSKVFEDQKRNQIEAKEYLNSELYYSNQLFSHVNLNKPLNKKTNSFYNENSSKKIPQPSSLYSKISYTINNIKKTNDVSKCISFRNSSELTSSNSFRKMIFKSVSKKKCDLVTKGNFDTRKPSVIDDYASNIKRKTYKLKKTLQTNSHCRNKSDSYFSYMIFKPSEKNSKIQFVLKNRLSLPQNQYCINKQLELPKIKIDYITKSYNEAEDGKGISKRSLIDDKVDSFQNNLFKIYIRQKNHLEKNHSRCEYHKNIDAFC